MANDNKCELAARGEGAPGVAHSSQTGVYHVLTCFVALARPHLFDLCCCHLLHLCTASHNAGCDYDSDCEDSCCMLDWDLGFISAPNCDGRRRSANGTQPVDAANLPPTKAQESPAGAGRRLQAANYDHQYNGPYRYGTAIVVWGTFYAANTATGEKWEDEGASRVL